MLLGLGELSDRLQLVHESFLRSGEDEKVRGEKVVRHYQTRGVRKVKSVLQGAEEGTVVAPFACGQPLPYLHPVLVGPLPIQGRVDEGDEGEIRTCRLMETLEGILHRPPEIAVVRVVHHYGNSLVAGEVISHVQIVLAECGQILEGG